MSKTLTKTFLEASKFYTHSENYWSNVDPSEGGMLDGYCELTPGDSCSSLAFIGELRRTGIIPQRDLRSHSSSNHNSATNAPSSPIHSGEHPPEAPTTSNSAQQVTSESLPELESAASAPAAKSTIAQLTNEDLQLSETAHSISNLIASISLASDANLAAPSLLERRLCRALDCGAGIGRVTKNVLLISFDAVDMAELSERSLAAAPEYIGRNYSRVERTYRTRLQDFTPDAGRVYDVVWLQWIVGHLLDDDLVALLSRLKTALSPPTHTAADSDANHNHNPNNSNNSNSYQTHTAATSNSGSSSRV